VSGEKPLVCGLESPNNAIEKLVPTRPCGGRLLRCIEKRVMCVCVVRAQSRKTGGCRKKDNGRTIDFLLFPARRTTALPFACLAGGAPFSFFPTHNNFFGDEFCSNDIANAFVCLWRGAWWGSGSKVWVVVVFGRVVTVHLLRCRCDCFLGADRCVGQMVVRRV